MAGTTYHNPDARTGELTGTQVGRYLVGERVGIGGMGEVYCADDPSLHRKVALKRMTPRLRADRQYRARFLREAQRASQLNNPHIAGIYDVLEPADEVLLVMEYVEGQTLRQRMLSPLSLEEVLTIALQCADALQAAHNAGIVHCDIKPDNIMIVMRSGGLQAKVLDFGVAKTLPHSDPEAPTPETTTQVLSGTPGYIAPEVLKEMTPDGRADIFSLGVVLYEALSGQNPFQASTMFQTAERVMHMTPPPLHEVNPAVTPEFEAVIFKMLAKDRSQRYLSADDLLNDLRALENPAELRQMIARAATGPKRWHAAMLVAIGALFSVGLLIAGYKAGAFGRLFGTAKPTRTIAVLPFDPAKFRSELGDPSAEARTRAFSDGLAETVAARLGRLADRYPIQIVPPSEVRELGVSNTDQARRVLGVNLVLAFSIRQAGNQVRVNYSLVDAGTRTQVRADSVTAESSNPFAVEDRVVDSVLETLEVALAPQDRRKLMAHRTAEPQAYDFYLQGRGYLQDYHKPENVASAIEVFQSALQRDPNYALAYAGLGEAYWAKYDLNKETEWARQALEACQRAVQLDSSAAEGHECLATVYDGTGKYDSAVTEAQRALAIEPASDHADRDLGRAYEALKKLPDAEAAFKHAIALRPNYWAGYNQLGGFYFRQNRSAEAVEMFKRVVALAPDNFRGYSNLAGVYLTIGDYAQAIPYLEKSVEIRPTGEAYSNLGIAYFYLRRYQDAAKSYAHAVELMPGNHILWGNLGEAYYWIAGRREDATRALRQAVKLADDTLQVNPQDNETWRDAAGYYAMLGEKNKALDCIRRALAVAPQDSESMFKAAQAYHLSGDEEHALEWLRRARAAGFGPERLRDDPAFANVKDDPRFASLMK